jgi:hypothetical protein
MLYYVIAKNTNQRALPDMAITLDLGETASLSQGLTEPALNWLTTHVGIIYYRDEIWRHNQQIISHHNKPEHPLKTVLSNIQAEFEYPQECVIMNVIHACGWNFTCKRKLATCSDSIALKQSRSTILRIEDESHALRFALEWM